MQILFGSVRTLRNDSLMTLVSPQIAIWRVFKYLSAEYRRKLSDDISTKCWAILGPYSVSKSTDSRPTLVRQVIQVGRPLVDTLSVRRSTLDRNLDRYTLHSTVGAYRSSVAELCIIVLSVVSYLISNWAISIPMLFSHNFKTNSSNVFEWVSLDSSCHIYWFSECATWALEPNTKFLSSLCRQR